MYSNKLRTFEININYKLDFDMNIVCSLPWQNANIFYFSCLKRSGCYGDATRVFSHPLHDNSSCLISTSSLREEFSRNYLRAEKIELLTWGEDIVTNSPHIRGPGESILKILSTSRTWLWAGAVPPQQHQLEWESRISVT